MIYMTDIRNTNGTCPSCGKAVIGYSSAARDYGSPIRTCKGCGQQYLDSRYIELAVEPPAPRDFKAGAGLKIALLGLIIFVISGALTLSTISHHGYYSMKALLTMILSIVLILFGIIDAVRVKTGAKQKSLDRKRAESEQRLMDRSYARLLADLGYNVPDKYL